MKRFRYLLAFGVLAAGIGGCSGQERILQTSEAEAEAEEVPMSQDLETTAAETVPAEPADPLERIQKQENQGAPQGMALYRSLPFVYEDQEWQLCLYVPQEMTDGQELFLDDRCDFIIQAEWEQGVYTLFEDTVQLGVPEGDIWIDQENQLHIVIRDARSAQYCMTDYIYDSQEEVFLGEQVIHGEGINYIGGL